LDAAENRKILPSDYADPSHYAAGAYSDVFVTNDTTLHDAHALLSWSSVRPIRLAEFSRRYLS